MRTAQETGLREQSEFNTALTGTISLGLSLVVMFAAMGLALILAVWHGVHAFVEGWPF